MSFPGIPFLWLVVESVYMQAVVESVYTQVVVESVYMQVVVESVYTQVANASKACLLHEWKLVISVCELGVGYQPADTLGV